jgi:DNA primase
MIPDDVVERVREEADIVSVIGEFVKLKRVGNSFRGPCPFHHGKNDNFSVTMRGGYKCFVCGESGDVFTFVQKHLGLDFAEAVKWVGAKAGVEVREVSRHTEERDPREPLWEVNATAAEFFRTQLWEAPAGKIGREYLTSRGISREDADRFGIGYAPRDAGAMRGALAALGFDDERQLAAGLLIVREDRPEPRPRFRDRLIFPIYDVSGHNVGFGGRILGDGEPKYLNSADSEIFSKRKLLYGLNWAKQAIRKAERLVIVEGYFDVIRLILAGINEVVAPMGTALTEQQAALIRKYTKHVFLLYDSDQAGLKATFRSGDELLANGVTARVITLPEGEDPDTFVAKFGLEGFERAADASVDVFDRKIQILERGGWFADLRRKREALDKLLPTIRVTSDQVLRDLYVARTSEVAGVSREVLIRELQTAPR